MDVKHDFQNQWSHMTNNVANMPDDELRENLQASRQVLTALVESLANRPDM